MSTENVINSSTSMATGHAALSWPFLVPACVQPKAKVMVPRIFVILTATLRPSVDMMSSFESHCPSDMRPRRKNSSRRWGAWKGARSRSR